MPWHWDAWYEGALVKLTFGPHCLDVLSLRPDGVLHRLAFDEFVLSDNASAAGDDVRLCAQAWSERPGEATAEHVFWLARDTFPSFKRIASESGATLADLHVSWHMEELLGEGSFAQVFAVVSADGKRSPAAAKIFLGDLSGEPEKAAATWRDFRSEVRILRRIQGHKAVPRLFAVYRGRMRQRGATATRAAIVLSKQRELLWDGYLRDYPALAYLEGRDKPRIAEAAVARCTLQILKALDFLHEARKIAHCDVKLDNVMLAADKTVVLVDFGLSMDLRTDTVTALGRGYRGTIGYIAPEVIMAAAAKERPGELDLARADVFSVGVIVFKLLTGEAPFKGEGTKAVLAANARGHVPDDVLLHAEASSDARHCVRTLCARLATRPPAGPASQHPWFDEDSVVRAPNLHEVLLPDAAGLFPDRTVAGTALPVPSMQTWPPRGFPMPHANALRSQSARSARQSRYGDRILASTSFRIPSVTSSGESSPPIRTVPSAAGTGHASLLALDGMPQLPGATEVRLPVASGPDDTPGVASPASPASPQNPFQGSPGQRPPRHPGRRLVNPDAQRVHWQRPPVDRPKEDFRLPSDEES